MLHLFDVHLDWREHHAATTIQKYYRGHRARRRTVLHREFMAFQRMKRKVERRRNAATTIQVGREGGGGCLFRGI